MAGCDFGWVQPTVGGYCVHGGTGTTPKDLGNSAFDDIADSAAKAAGSTVKALGSAWMDIQSPLLSQDSGPVAFLRGSTLWLTTFTAVLCLLIAAGHIAWQRRSAPGRQALQGLLNLVVVSSAGVAAVNLLTVAGDKFSVWIIDRSTGCEAISSNGTPVEQCVAMFNDRTTAMLALGGTDLPFLVLIMAILVIVGSVAQIALMIVRVAMLVILAGTLPLSAAASSTPAGSTWFRKTVGWLLAFVLYKPAAAVVYAAAFSMTGEAKGNEVVSMVSGVVLVVLASFTLPALLRFAAPVVQATAARSSRGGKTSTDGAGPAVATGAQSVPQLRGLAAGRSVAGTAQGSDGAGSTGLRTGPGGTPGSRSAPARGAGSPPGAPGGENTNDRRAPQQRSAQQAHPRDRKQRSAAPSHHDGPEGQEASTAAVGPAQYDHDQQGASDGSN
ncbi:hypothetical protein ACIBL8_45930 [Streptomyces sp. NPDC050523]|uniref:hypothetical protein n=1 Tax=Streptomyces sp. NPDC050523 TaxID=3365622 RepID=UPI0037A1F654